MAKKTFKLQHRGFKTYSTFQDIEYIEFSNRDGTITNRYMIQAVVMSDNKTLRNYRVMKACPLGFFTQAVAKNLFKDTLTEARRVCKAK